MPQSQWPHHPPLLVFIACSLDGFIARPDGNLDWLDQAAASGVGEDHGYEAFMACVDTLVMGRGTFEKVLTFPAWPYAGKRVIVLSRSLAGNDLPVHLREVVELHGETLVELLPKLADSRGVYVDGGQVIQSFLRAGLIDELIITRLPVLLGQGLPLFGALDSDIALKHVQTRVFEGSGFVQSVYRPLHGASALA